MSFWSWFQCSVPENVVCIFNLIRKFSLKFNDTLNAPFSIAIRTLCSADHMAPGMQYSNATKQQLFQIWFQLPNVRKTNRKHCVAVSIILSFNENGEKWRVKRKHTKRLIYRQFCLQFQIWFSFRVLLFLFGRLFRLNRALRFIT